MLHFKILGNCGPRTSRPINAHRDYTTTSIGQQTASILASNRNNWGTAVSQLQDGLVRRVKVLNMFLLTGFFANCQAKLALNELSNVGTSLDLSQCRAVRVCGKLASSNNSIIMNLFRYLAYHYHNYFTKETDTPGCWSFLEIPTKAKLIVTSLESVNKIIVT